MPESVLPVILAGGTGARLWPLSNGARPKPFLRLAGDATLLQATARRLAPTPADGLRLEAPLVVTGEAWGFLAQDQLHEAGMAAGAIVLEPAPRGTAAALTLATLAGTQEGGDPILVACPSDHHIADAEAFRRAIRTAADAAGAGVAAGGAIVALGVPAHRAETGFGYIQAEAGTGARRAVSFVEKPDARHAARLVREGWFWNAGIFVVRASAWLALIERWRPDIASGIRRAWAGRRTEGRFIRPGREAFEAVPADSIDRAVMEHCSDGLVRAGMVELRAAGWSDVGTWDAVWDASPKDAEGNAHSGDVVSRDSRNTLVHATSRRVAVLGVDDIVVVETPEAVLVVKRNAAGEVGALAAAATASPSTHRPAPGSATPPPPRDRSAPAPGPGARKPTSPAR